MIGNFFEWDSILRIFSQTAQNKSFELNGHENLFSFLNLLEPELLVTNLPFQIGFAFALKGQKSVCHFEKHYSDRPNIRFDCINIWCNRLRRHVNWSSHIKRIFRIFIQILNESKIRNHVFVFLSNFVLNEDVWGLDVPVNKASGVKMQVAFMKLIKNVINLCFA